MGIAHHIQQASPLAVVALGGNAVVLPGQQGSIPEQNENAELALRRVLPALLERGFRILLTHGNGPQVGNVLTRVEASRNLIYTLPLDVCVADTQGGMGYMFQRIVRNLLAETGVEKSVVTLITQVVVDERDPAFEHPTKPIGKFYTREEALRLQTELGWQMVEDAGRGYRRVVPSPRPRQILELLPIRTLLASDTIVIAAGGGGIPVVERNGRLFGVAAVVDKDLTSSLLAVELDADLLVILTGVPAVFLNYGTAEKLWLKQITLQEARRYLYEGQFPPGSMGPKIEAAIQFVERRGREVLITCHDRLQEALAGKAGTRVVPSEEPGR